MRTRTPRNGHDTDPTAKYGGGKAHTYVTRSGYLLVVQMRRYVKEPKIRPKTQTTRGYQQVELAANELIM